MLLHPPQSMPITRGLTAARDAATHGVAASQSRCSNLTGPAQSMCYAALYGIYD
jgi:hypothetical protein